MGKHGWKIHPSLNLIRSSYFNTKQMNESDSVVKGNGLSYIHICVHQHLYHDYCMCSVRKITVADVAFNSIENVFINVRLCSSFETRNRIKKLKFIVNFRQTSVLFDLKLTVIVIYLSKFCHLTGICVHSSEKGAKFFDRNS